MLSVIKTFILLIYIIIFPLMDRQEQYISAHCTTLVLCSIQNDTALVIVVH